jgi:hypothetical protein
MNPAHIQIALALSLLACSDATQPIYDPIAPIPRPDVSPDAPMDDSEGAPGTAEEELRCGPLVVGINYEKVHSCAASKRDGTGGNLYDNFPYCCQQESRRLPSEYKYRVATWEEYLDHCDHDEVMKYTKRGGRPEFVVAKDAAFVPTGNFGVRPPPKLDPTHFKTAPYGRAGWAFGTGVFCIEVPK